jgi:hypothetical protein
MIFPLPKLAADSANPPMEGMLVRGEQGVDTGDRIQVTLISTNPERGFNDFAR